MEQRSTADQLTPTKREPQMLNNIIMFGLAHVVAGITLTVASFKLAEQNRQTAKLFAGGFVLLVLLIDLTYLSTAVRLQTGPVVLYGFVGSFVGVVSVALLFEPEVQEDTDNIRLSELEL
jgi:uncharacterized membrane protein HdeD (DUF308 family)